MDGQRGKFGCKKWTLIVFAVLGMISTVIMASMATTLVDTYVDENYQIGHPYTDTDIDSIKSSAKTFIYAAAIIALLFDLMGAMGAYREHYCLIMTYAILMTIAAVVSVSAAVKTPYYWFNTVMDFIICVIAYSYLHDLRQRRLQRLAAGAQPMWLTTGPDGNQTLVNMAPVEAFRNPYGTAWQTPLPPRPPPYSLDNKNVQNMP